MSWKEPPLLETVNYELALSNIDRKVESRKRKLKEFFFGRKVGTFKVGDIVAHMKFPNFVCEVIDITGNVNQIIVTKYLKEPHYIETSSYSQWVKIKKP